MRAKTHARWAAALVGASVGAVAVGLELRQFVAGWSIEPPADAEVFDVPVTADLYAVAGDLDRVAVLDGTASALPFFRRAAPLAEPAEQGEVLEASPLYADGTVGRPAVGVTTTERGTSVTVTADGAASPQIVGFVLDARNLAAAPIALELDWRSLPQPFLVDVLVEQSDDLTRWRAVGRASVAALEIGGAEVRHARVGVRATAGGYLRVTAARAVQGWYLERATLVSATVAAPEPLTLTLAPLPSAQLPEERDADARVFDAGGRVPVTALTLGFAGGSGWARADVAVSASLEGPWTTVAYGALFYSLGFDGERFDNPVVGVGRREARYWRVRFADPVRGSSPQLVLEYPQEYLRVAASGNTPYLLVAGTLSDEVGPDATFASVFSTLARDSQAVPVAGLGARRELGGAAALAVERPFPWRTFSLWAVLIGGVLVVGFMAVRLAREMQPS